MIPSYDIIFVLLCAWAKRMGRSFFSLVSGVPVSVGHKLGDDPFVFLSMDANRDALSDFSGLEI